MSGKLVRSPSPLFQERPDRPDPGHGFVGERIGACLIFTDPQEKLDLLVAGHQGADMGRGLDVSPAGNGLP